MSMEEINKLKERVAQISSDLDALADTMRAGSPRISGHKIAICVGHSRSLDNGAVSVGQVSEWNFWNLPGHKLARRLEERGVNAFPVSSYEGSSYSRAMAWLGDKLSREGATGAVELHFNAAGPAAQGYEHLFWKGSSRGRDLARALNDAQARAFPDRRNRGTKERRGDRGSGFLSETPCPAVIMEPFFGTSPEEWNFYSRPSQLDRLIDSMADGIEKWVRDGF